MIGTVEIFPVGGMRTLTIRPWARQRLECEIGWGDCPSNRLAQFNIYCLGNEIYVEVFRPQGYADTFLAFKREDPEINYAERLGFSVSGGLWDVEIFDVGAIGEDVKLLFRIHREVDREGLFYMFYIGYDDKTDKYYFSAYEDTFGLLDGKELADVVMGIELP